MGFYEKLFDLVGGWWYLLGMRKFVFLCLLTAFFSASFLNAAGAGCHAEHDGHLCKMYDDVQEHEQAAHGCVGCHLNIAFPEVLQFSFFDYGLSENPFKISDCFLFFDDFSYLYRPPIC